MKTQCLNSLLCLAAMMALPAVASADRQALRIEQEINRDWQFSHDQQQWQAVELPHDWAISGPFDKQWDLQRVAITQNGETEATEKSGRSGALPWIGRGYYRHQIDIPAGYSRAVLVFDGAMAEPVVSVNGREAGRWAYGYNAFRIDITQLLKGADRLQQQGSRGNTVEVSLQNVEESSRWYPGAGIYRPVTLELTTDPVSIDRWGTYCRTEQLSSDVAIVSAGTMVSTGNSKFSALSSQLRDGLAIELAVLNQKGHVMDETHLTPTADGQVKTTLRVEKPEPWSPDSPTLYSLRTRLYRYGQLIDETTTRVGLRTVSVSKDKGFQLNGQTVKLRGVCLHHDLGPLGAAVNKAALVRQIKTMKAMGANAIRTSHNMPSTWQMDICDSLGMMVMAESFDMWGYAKCKNGYARFFKEWSDRDIENLILCHRNHPSIVMWSIGNEIPEQGMKGGTDMARHLQDLCHKLDPTRPVTQGMDRAESALSTGFAQVMDVPGFNYRVQKYPKNMEQLPQGFLLGSETASTVSSRGVYKFPVKPDDNSRFASWAKGYDPKAIEKADGQCSSYDVEYCTWSNLPDDDWVWQDYASWCIGEFVWTGYDYLGEPTPYDEYWPSRSSYFGICDLAGLPKDRYYLYRAHWNQQEPTLHLLPHWTWGTDSKATKKARKKTEGRIGQVTPVYCYTSYPEAELFVNGKSQGRRRQGHLTIDGDKAAQQRLLADFKAGQPSLDLYRLRWNDVKYEPGEIRVVAYDANGNKAAEQSIRTAGRPVALRCAVETPLSDNGTLKADGQDLAFVTCWLEDQDGNICPTATDNLSFQVSGQGSYRAACNGDATSLQAFTKPEMRLFSGKLVAIVQAGRQQGKAVLHISDAERQLETSVEIPVR